MNQRLADDVIDVLRRSTTRDNVLILPEGQLDRSLYERVNKALANAGGKWKRGTGHVFASDAAPKLAAMLDTGISIDEKKRDQAFFTPPALAQQVVELADVRGHDVLEPSAGEGALADTCMQGGASQVFCIELNPERARVLESKGYVTTQADFLTLSVDEYFSRVVTNPPFTKNQDIDHVRHALRYLAPKGILVAIMFGNQERKGFKAIVDDYDAEVIEVERGAFREAGTDIATVILKVELP